MCSKRSIDEYCTSAGSSSSSIVSNISDISDSNSSNSNSSNSNSSNSNSSNSNSSGSYSPNEYCINEDSRSRSLSNISSSYSCCKVWAFKSGMSYSCSNLLTVNSSNSCIYSSISNSRASGSRASGSNISGNRNNSTTSNISRNFGDAACQIGRRVLDELIETERTYLDDMSSGYVRYTLLFNNVSDLPDGLQNQQDVFLSNISQIIALHRHKLLPLMLEQRNELEQLFTRWLKLLDNDACYCYVLFVVRQRATTELYAAHKAFFRRMQTTLCDPLGMSSFLLRPVQRLTRYPLLLTNLIELLYSNNQVVSKGLIELICRVEKRIRELLDRVNHVDHLNDIHNFDAFSILNVSRFVAVGEFWLIDHSRRSYKGKLFTFTTCFLYTENKKGKHLIRGKFTLPDVCFVAQNRSFLLCNKLSSCEFTCDGPTVEKWERIIWQLIRDYGIGDDNVRDDCSTNG